MVNRSSYEIAKAVLVAISFDDGSGLVVDYVEPLNAKIIVYGFIDTLDPQPARWINCFDLRPHGVNRLTDVFQGDIRTALFRENAEAIAAPRAHFRRHSRASGNHVRGIAIRPDFETGGWTSFRGACSRLLRVCARRTLLLGTCAKQQGYSDQAGSPHSFSKATVMSSSTSSPRPNCVPQPRPHSERVMVVVPWKPTVSR